MQINEDFRQFSISTMNEIELESDEFSQIFFKILKTNHWIYANINDGCWYQYLTDENHWKISNKHTVENLLRNIINEYDNIIHKYLENTYYGKTNYETMQRKYLANCRTIMNGGFQREIYDELLELFKKDTYSVRFAKKLDRDYTKISCKNGILLETSTEIIISQPDHFISLSTQIIYEKPNQKILDTLIQFLEQVFLNFNDYLEFLVNIKRGLWGKPVEPIYIVGENYCGIQLLENILRWAFGDYLYFYNKNGISMPIGIRLIIAHNPKNKDLELLKRNRSQIIVISTIDINPTKKSLYCTKEITRLKEYAKTTENIILIDPILDEETSDEIGNAFLWLITH